MPFESVFAESLGPEYDPSESKFLFCERMCAVVEKSVFQWLGFCGNIEMIHFFNELISQCNKWSSTRLQPYSLGGPSCTEIALPDLLEGMREGHRFDLILHLISENLIKSGFIIEQILRSCAFSADIEVFEFLEKVRFLRIDQNPPQNSITERIFLLYDPNRSYLIRIKSPKLQDYTFSSFCDLLLEQSRFESLICWIEYFAKRNVFTLESAHFTRLLQVRDIIFP